MSYQSGWKALNLEFSDRVPRTEYSAHCYHWDLVHAVTGMGIATDEEKEKASREFLRIWDYGFLWMTPTAGNEVHKFGRATSMGHAEFAAGGTDLDTGMQCPFKTVEDVYSFDPFNEYGEKDIDKLAKELNGIYIKDRDYYGDITLTMGGVYPTMFSGLIEMFGWDMLLTAMGTDPERFGKVIESYYRWIKQYFDAWARTEIKVFMSHDDICWTSGPVTHPEWYRKYIFPYYKKLWEPILSKGIKLIFTADGTYDMFFDDIVKAGAGTLVMEPGNDMKYFADKYGKTHGFVGDADTRILLSGTKDDIYKEVKRCMDIGKKYPGFFLAVGNHIPANTPVDNALYYNEAYMKLSKR